MEMVFLNHKGTSDRVPEKIGASHGRLVCAREGRCDPEKVGVSQLKPLPCQWPQMEVAPRDHTLAGLELRQGRGFREVL